MGEGGISHTTKRRLGIEYNNMATIHYQTPYQATASESNTITLAGESSSAVFSPDYTIDVPMDLSQVVTASGAYATITLDSVISKTYPNVTFHASLLAAAALDTEGTWVARDTMDNLSGMNSDVPSLRKLFRISNFNYSSPVFTDYPVEAVIEVVQNSMTVTRLSELLQDATSKDENSDPVNAFEQCLAAGKFTAADLKDGDSTATAVFAQGDVIQIYVAYSLTKSRAFELDGVKGSDTASIQVGNITLDSKGASETSDAFTVNVCWRFRQN
jgi:hypothetical protein